MSVTCRRQDQKRFADLGFHLEFESSPESPVIEMVDKEANYAHSSEMPKDIPYHGINGAGDNYSAGNCACDGREYAEVETGQGSEFILAWNFRFGLPTLKSILQVRRFLKIRRRAEKVIRELETAYLQLITL
jgi:hypothetical protein